jgi:hypothetical protein
MTSLARCASEEAPQLHAAVTPALDGDHGRAPDVRSVRLVLHDGHWEIKFIRAGRTARL